MGTSRLCVVIYRSCRDHPHACGDKKLSYSFHIAGVGSSPRVWGQDTAIFYTYRIIRIIPTRVGTRLISSLGFPIAWDHPHACGDKHHIESRLDIGKGSSPRVWGQDSRDFIRFHQPGIIPTRVGTRTQTLYAVSVMLGSSPRVWGQGCVAMFWQNNKRIIPTRVGTR